MTCRYCNSETTQILDLGYSPPSNQYIHNTGDVECYFPLVLISCNSCGLLQTSADINSQLLFDDEYSYFSSYSSTWLSHCEQLVDEIEEKFKYKNVIEVASNDGYLLEILKKRGIKAYGIEPTKSTAEVAIQKKLDVVNDFLTIDLAKKLAKDKGKADILIANNVLAHVPDIKDFVQSIYTLLSTDGVAIIEFPYAKNLVQENQFDTIYHEHYSYFTLSTLKTIFNENKLEIVNVKNITTHGGSLRIYGKKMTNKSKVSPYVNEMLINERQVKINTNQYFSNMQKTAFESKIKLLHFLIDCKSKDKKVVAYGAAAKGNTLLNYCGIKKDLIEFVVDKNPHKIGKLLPGSHIPIKNEEILKIEQPDYIIILPWNLMDEVIFQLDYAREWGAKFVIAIPSLIIK
jgi:SAM-dependent methyltransferase